MSAAARKRTDQLTIGHLLVLMGGAAIGMAIHRMACHRLLYSIDFGWREVVFALYLALAGVAMAASVLMLVERYYAPRPWTPPAASLFSIGLVAWTVTPFLTNTFVVFDSCSQPDLWFRHFFLAYEPGAMALAGFSRVWPLLSLSLLAACAASGQVPRWWQMRGAWPDWLGMWMLAAWSLPAVSLVYRAVAGTPAMPELP
jgi:hypothetical protein